MAQPDFRETRGTYEGFITLFKWGTVAVGLVTAFVVLIIS
jgi:Bacterial aa3 type cytochrome c oxidase subunit IV